MATETTDSKPASRDTRGAATRSPRARKRIATSAQACGKSRHRGRRAPGGRPGRTGCAAILPAAQHRPPWAPRSAAIRSLTMHPGLASTSNRCRFLSKEDAPVPVALDTAAHPQAGCIVPGW